MKDNANRSIVVIGLLILAVVIAIVLTATMAFGQYATSPDGTSVIKRYTQLIDRAKCGEVGRDRPAVEDVMTGAESSFVTTDNTVTAVATAPTGRLTINNACGELSYSEFDTSFGGNTEVTIVPEQVRNTYVRLKPYSGGKVGSIIWRQRTAYVQFRDGAVYGLRFGDVTGTRETGYITFREPFSPRPDQQYLMVISIAGRETFFHFKVDSSGYFATAVGNRALM